MVQNVSREIENWLDLQIDEYSKYQAKQTLRAIRDRFAKYGPETEKLIFKYIARYVIDRVNPPTSIQGMSIDYPKWTPLKDSYIKKKGHRRKYFNSGRLQKYLSDIIKNPVYFYTKPLVKIDYKNYKVTYYSMFRNGRKEFSRQDGSQEGVTFEDKVSDNESKGRVLIQPMEEFLLYKKLNSIMDKKIKEYLELGYYEKFVPTIGQ